LSVDIIIYDLDGTLIDSAQTVLSIVNEMRRELAKDPIDKSSLVPWISLGGLHLIANALELDQSVAQKSLEDFRGRYLQYCAQESDLYPEVRKTLNALSQFNKNLAICTNKPRNLVDKILAELSLGRYFDCIVAGGDLTTQKPHPQNLLKCLNHLGCAPGAAILVGDSSVDQKIAHACGVPFAFFRPGYNDGVDDLHATITLNAHSDLLGLSGLHAPI
jgi:phosphoglycolate phosphatase